MSQPCAYCDSDDTDVMDILVAGSGTIYECNNCDETFDTGDINA